MSVYMLKIRLKEAQADLRIQQIKDAIFDVEACEWHDRGWRSRERNA